MEDEFYEELKSIYFKIYGPDKQIDFSKKLEEQIFLTEEELTEKLKKFHQKLINQKKFFLEKSSKNIDLKKFPKKTDWFKDSVIYSLYVDLFNINFSGLISKLDYLQELGVSCLWLLPVLESPLKDMGFDISNYKKIRSDLIGKDEKILDNFLAESHKRNIKVIFDVAINHSSSDHKWFLQSKIAKNVKNSKRNFYMWSEKPDLFLDANIIFKGICTSNWEYDETAKQYFFHRFFPTQPDLNFRCPDVLFKIAKTLVYWRVMGFDGFRADACAVLWKKDGTKCVNLPETHLILKFFRSCLNFIKKSKDDEDSLLLAEVCKKPIEIIEYFGNGSECNAAYHFPLMPRIFYSIADEKKNLIEEVLDPSFTPKIPENSQWFTFLRCHDELTGEHLSSEQKKFLFEKYLTNEKYNFRDGIGIGSRLATLFGNKIEKILLAFSILFSIGGSPIIYYGDELGKENDEDFFELMFKKTNYNDARYYCRGFIDWKAAEKDLKNENSKSYKIYFNLKKLLKIRKEFNVFGRGELIFLNLKTSENKVNESLLSYVRSFEGLKILIIQNLSSFEQKFVFDENLFKDSKINDLFENELIAEEKEKNLKEFKIKPHGFYWIKI